MNKVDLMDYINHNSDCEKLLFAIDKISDFDIVISSLVRAYGECCAARELSRQDIINGGYTDTDIQQALTRLEK